MKIVVVSDNHGDIKCLKDILKIENDAAYFIHCGDSELLAHDLSGFVAVNGNNDYFLGLDDERVLDIDGFRILILHGHRVGLYANGSQNLVNKALQHQCNMICFGHTHTPYYEEYQGVHLLNPGSISRPRTSAGKTYAIINLDKKDVTIDFCSYQR